MNAWGRHTLIDCKGCDKFSFTKNNIAGFVKYLVEKIDMVAYGDPVIEHFATHDPDKGGYTLSQMIETSLVAAHFVDATGEAYFDVHSCKDFNENDVLEAIQLFFDPTHRRVTTVFRGEWL